MKLSEKNIRRTVGWPKLLSARVLIGSIFSFFAGVVLAYVMFGTATFDPFYRFLFARGHSEHLKPVKELSSHPAVSVSVEPGPPVSQLSDEYKNRVGSFLRSLARDESGSKRREILERELRDRSLQKLIGGEPELKRLLADLFLVGAVDEVQLGNISAAKILVENSEALSPNLRGQQLVREFMGKQPNQESLEKQSTDLPAESSRSVEPSSEHLFHIMDLPDVPRAYVMGIVLIFLVIGFSVLFALNHYLIGLGRIEKGELSNALGGGLILQGFDYLRNILSRRRGSEAYVGSELSNTEMRTPGYVDVEELHVAETTEDVSRPTRAANE